ncbi:hypothetical protein DV515_00011817 [Chloebia gouldiae]|uniref:Uncharacterized protein n=1 Tax=Chloebia gouldiae TaxID=44316 RepID=A0A3L8S595_CHLGU|nr:hypothetical protein DV515_00011817 [Chloebia gouldiae]
MDEAQQRPRSCARAGTRLCGLFAKGPARHCSAERIASTSSLASFCQDCLEGGKLAEGSSCPRSSTCPQKQEGGQ